MKTLAFTCPSAFESKENSVWVFFTSGASDSFFKERTKENMGIFFCSVTAAASHSMILSLQYMSLKFSLAKKLQLGFSRN